MSFCHAAEDSYEISRQVCSQNENKIACYLLQELFAVKMFLFCANKVLPIDYMYPLPAEYSHEMPTQIFLERF